MATLHTHTPAALGRPNHLMHDTHACANPTVATAPTWSIEAVTPATLKEASVFVNASRKALFPSLGYDTLLDDPNVLETSCVLIARDQSNTVVATIAYIPFDYRFPHLPWPVGLSRGASTPASYSSSSQASANSSTSSLNSSVLLSEPPYKIVEVVRLFVLPQHRRHGLAASLFQSIQNRAVASGVHCMYLHTHPFLPGAIRFWEKQGFDIIRVDAEDEVWQTHHMQKMLIPPQSGT
jgi:GNAT superfamily N-acetyltransferase